MFFLQVLKKNKRFAHSLFFNEQCEQMLRSLTKNERCERIAQVACQKWGDEQIDRFLERITNSLIFSQKRVIH